MDLEENDNDNTDDGNQPQIFFWGGRIRHLPENYALPNGTGLSVFRVWMLPDTEMNISALQYCSANDFENTNSRKRFSDLSILMKIQGDRIFREPKIFLKIPPTNYYFFL